MDPSVRGLHVVVTGATGELGGALAALLLERGAELHLPVRSAGKLDGQLARAHVVEGVDLADETAVTGFYRDLPGLWASIHCAGAFAFAPLLETGVDTLERMLAINTRSAFLCAREAARRMKGRGGRIVNVIARQALDPRRGAGMSAYTLSKSALAALTLALSEELSSERILVNAVAPSVMDTPANRAAMPKVDPATWVSLDEVARALAWLASEECSASGSLVPIYGRA